MVSYVLDTLRQAVRGPGPWVLLGLGVLAGWGSLNLAVLALGKAKVQAPGIVLGTGHAVAVLAALWVLARLLEADRRSLLCLAADCTRPGPAGRLAGRWVGTVLVAILLGWLVQLVLGLVADVSPEPGPLPLYITTIEVAALAGVWGLLIATVWPGGPVVLLGLVAWFLGHLPWGGPGLLEGHLGTGIGALLPGPRDPAMLGAHLAATAAAVGGGFLLALAAGTRPLPRT